MKKIYGIIELSFLNIQFKIMQKKYKSIELLEESVFPISLYKEGKDSKYLVEVERICNILNNIKEICEGYGLKRRDIKFFGGNPIKELKNREFLREQIKVKTSLNLEILDTTKEGVLLYKHLLNTFSPELFSKENALILFATYEELTIYMSEKGKICKTQSFSNSPIKFKEIFKEIDYNPRKKDKVLLNYLESNIEFFKNFYPDIPPNRVYLISENLADITDKKKVLKDDLIEKIEEIENKDVMELINEYNLPQVESNFYLEKISIIKALISLFDIEKINLVNYSLIDIYAENLTNIQKSRKFDREVKDSIILSMTHIGEKYLFNKENVFEVKKNVELIFNVLSKQHQFGQRDLLVLKGAALLHDIGKFINQKNHYRLSKELIDNSQIFGLTVSEIEKISILAYYHSKMEPDINSRYIRDFSDLEKMKLIKLIALLRIADSLDRSHNQVIDNITVSITENKLVIKGETDSDVPLIKWSFEKKSMLFKDVFGIDTELKIVRR